MNNLQTQYFAIIPAAGSGSRFSSELPKQYVRLNDQTLIEWSLRPFLEADWINEIIIVLSAEDRYFSQLAIANHPKIKTVIGGIHRQDSVMAGLYALDANPEDYILVHDAARPNLHAADLIRLRDELSNHPVGGLLGAIVVDSIKRVADGRVIEAVPREDLYRALTPQMFRFGILKEALQNFYPHTDESTAVQLAGHAVQMVLGRSDNIKVTVADDLVLVQLLTKI
ncbi:MAG: 2-C-methyl-D-erythritol 4-phosphate cytidylyltransferase [Pseudomonadota bacterium]|nr:2-C-methyl-D-erythritol 4-phosphate cytidylyltransferase [Pseudomonadota bacterium]